MQNFDPTTETDVYLWEVHVDSLAHIGMFLYDVSYLLHHLFIKVPQLSHIKVSL